MTLQIEKLVPGGEGLARHAGRVVFVPGVLPGEIVAAEVTETRKDFWRARLLRVEEPSAQRASPPCPLFGTCGGCDWQHIDPNAQVGFKLDIARDALRRTGGIEWPDLGIESGPALGYRNRLQLHTDGSGAVGFLRRSGHGLVAAKHCPVAHPAFAPLFAHGCEAGAPERFAAFAGEGADGSPQLWRADRDPGAEVAVRVRGRVFVFPVTGFFQSNLALLPRLLDFVLAGLTGKTALDLYAGAGLFGAFLGETFARVVCVESQIDLLPYARRNVGAEGAVFLAGRLEELAADRVGLLRREAADAAVVDPPREGLAPAVCAFLGEARIPRIIYVSCNPVTLARDLKALLAGPYALEDLRLFDFFPHTSHVEAAAKLRLRD